MSRITPPKEEAGTQLNQLIKERDTWKAAGRKDIVDQYNKVIENFGTDSFERLWGAQENNASPGDTAAVPPAAASTEPVKLTPEDEAALDWAQKHKEDLRAAAILQRLGVK
jgi:hypothetical protein